MRLLTASAEENKVKKRWLLEAASGWDLKSNHAAKREGAADIG